MAKRKEIMRAMREAGMTYEQIGDAFGVSKQAVHQYINCGDGFNLGAVMKIPYMGLRMWMLEHRVTARELCRRTGVNLTLTKRSSLSMHTIDKILKVTGLTYEECFKTEECDEPPAEATP